MRVNLFSVGTIMAAIMATQANSMQLDDLTIPAASPQQQSNDSHVANDLAQAESSIHKSDALGAAAKVARDLTLVAAGGLMGLLHMMPKVQEQKTEIAVLETVNEMNEGMSGPMLDLQEQISENRQQVELVDSDVQDNAERIDDLEDVVYEDFGALADEFEDDDDLDEDEDDDGVIDENDDRDGDIKDQKEIYDDDQIVLTDYYKPYDYSPATFKTTGP